MDLTTEQSKFTKISTSQAVYNRKTKISKFREYDCSSPAHVSSDFPRVWTELRQRRQFCDGIVHNKNGGKHYIHRAILSAVSPQFKAFFTRPSESRTKISNLRLDLPGYVLEAIFDYAYTGLCKVTVENVEQVLTAAVRLEVIGAVQQCCVFLIGIMCPKNCLGLFRCATPYLCRSMEEKCWRFILYSFGDILKKSKELVQLSAEELKCILSDDDLNVPNEEFVFEGVMKWVHTQPYRRRHHLKSLIHCPRYGLMSFNFFWNVVMNSQFIIHSQELQNSLYPASMFLAKLESEPGAEVDLNNPVARPRVPYEILFAIGGWSAGSSTSFVETYDIRADRWFLSVNTDATPRAYHGICVLDSIIYMIGGFDGLKHFNTVRCFNPETREWQERACMYHARCYVSVCVLGGKIYALGGYNGRTRTNSVERYSPSENQWELIASMRQRRSDASAASLNGKIYVIGGFNGREFLSSAEVFDPEQNQWTYIHGMNTARSGLSLVAFDGSLYALGGFNGFTRLNSGEKYKPTESVQWHPISNMFSPRSNFGTVVLDEMIFVIGGFNGFTTIALVESYDARKNEWYDVSAMNLNRSGLSACVIPGLPNAKEYSYLSKVQEMGQGALADTSCCTSV